MRSSGRDFFDADFADFADERRFLEHGLAKNLRKSAKSAKSALKHRPPTEVSRILGAAANAQSLLLIVILQQHLFVESAVLLGLNDIIGQYRQMH